MATTQDDMIAELQRANAELRRERDAAMALRNSEYGERIAHQAATIDVLKAMSASPGDPQPVFDLIVERARDLCDAYGSTVYEFDGTLIHWRAATGVSDDPSVRTSGRSNVPDGADTRVARGPCDPGPSPCSYRRSGHGTRPEPRFAGHHGEVGGSSSR